MKPRIRFLLMASILLLAALACTTIRGSAPTATPAPTNTPYPTNTPLPTPTEEITPEILNSGLNFYNVTKLEITCELNVSADQQYREIYFSENQAQIKSKDSDDYYLYEQIEPYRYMRINDADKPIVAEFSFTGFFLQVFDVGADPVADVPCGYFTFTLIEE